MLILITGKPGSFKTAKTATLAINYLKEGRPVYTNIDEFNYEGIQQLPENNDWTKTPDGSVVIYDEAQQFDFLQYKGREKLSSDNRVKQLEVHRHTGHDIILVTQSPSFIHNHVLSLVGSHWHLHRAFGRSFADAFLWRYTASNPDSTGAKNKAESHEKFKPDSKIFDQYKSTSIDTHKLKIPPLYYKLGAFLILVIAIILYMVFGSSNPFLSASAIKKNIDSTKNPQAVQQTDLDKECRQAQNLQKPECVQWYNDLTTNHKSVPPETSSQDQQQVAYNINKPFASADSVQQQVASTYTVRNKPIFSGCIKSHNRYIAYTQQGTILHEVSQEDCKRLIDNNDRPFDYFGDHGSKDLSVNAVPASTFPSDEQKAKIMYENKEGI